MGWTTPRTWVAAEKPSAATMNAHIRDNLVALNGYVLKTADESVTSSTALQNDNHLLYTIGATGTYAFDLYLLATSDANAAGDINIAFTFPTGTLRLWGPGPDPALASGTLAQGRFAAGAVTSGTAWQDFGLSTTSLGFNIHGLFIATATGTLQFQWAQFASNANATTVRAGSHLIVKQVA